MQGYRLPLQVERELQSLAASTGRTVAEVARKAVLDEIEAIEAYYLAISLARQQQRREAGDRASH